MKAIVFEEHGGCEVLQYRDTPIPKAGPNDVVINVKASACNFNDIWARRGLPGMKIILPHISGSDAAGVVVEAGSEVSPHYDPMLAKLIAREFGLGLLRLDVGTLFRSYVDSWLVRGFFIIMAVSFIGWGISGDILRLRQIRMLGIQRVPR